MKAMPLSPANTQCYLCDIVSDGIGKPYRLLFPATRLKSEIFQQSKYFAAILDIGPIVEGYVLIFTRAHRTGLNHLSNEEVKDLDNFLLRISNILFAAYRVTPQIFEHGSSNLSGNASCCVDHAHLHVIPYERRFVPSVEAKLFRSIKGLRDLRHFNDAYLYFRDSAGRNWIREDSPPSHQYFRKFLTRAVGAEVWNWMDYVLLGNALGTRSRLLAARKRLARVL